VTGVVPDTAPVASEALLAGSAITKHFPIRRGVLRRTVGQVRAVDGVDLAVPTGGTVGLVGESGSGKSTLGRVLLRLLDPTSGSIVFDGDDITTLPARQMRDRRRGMQLVFQDPFSSFDPLATIADSLAEPMRNYLDLDKRAREEKVGELLRTVRLDPDHRNRYPREFSGGQLQRVAIARALALSPKLLVLDEPVSSLDVSIQADIINLLGDLQDELGLSYLFIAHDLALVRHVSDRIAVMYLGRIVEQGPAHEVYERPKHPYTEALLSAIPVPHPARQRERERIVLQGDIPSPAAPPPGCRFHTRCHYAFAPCRTADPPAFTTPDGSVVACHLHTEEHPAGAPRAGMTVSGLPRTKLV
jgi:oligopeptide/dipeptide ABC transporter ATP-binding protein